VLSRVKVLVNYQGPPRSSKTAEIVELAIKHGCHYIDITGDSPFHRDLIAKHNEEVKKKDLCYILHQGFTALPVDIVTYCAVKHLREKHKTECKRAVVYTWSVGGGMSGTTFHAGLAMDQADQEGADDPFCLGGIRKCGVRDADKDIKKAYMDGFSSQWVGPDSLARADTRIVRRSCALFEDEDPSLSYGRNFNFQMVGLAPDRMAAGMMEMSVKTPMKLRERLVEQKKVPPVGFGPAERLRKEALAVRVVNAEGENGKEVHATMQSGPGGFGDGYQSSGIFSVIIATLLLTEWDKLPSNRRGFVTAAYLLGDNTTFYEMMAELLMVFKCKEGRCPQEYFRGLVGGVLAITTDEEALMGPPTAAAAGALPWDT